jgi:hypothetical protein
MRNKTLASAEQVETKKRLREEQKFSIRETSRNKKKGYMRNKSLSSTEQVGTKKKAIWGTKLYRPRNKSEQKKTT